MKLKFRGNLVTVEYKGKTKTFRSTEKAILYGMGYGSGIGAKRKYNKTRRTK